MKRLDTDAVGRITSGSDQRQLDLRIWSSDTSGTLSGSSTTRLQRWGSSPKNVSHSIHSPSDMLHLAWDRPTRPRRNAFAYVDGPVFRVLHGRHAEQFTTGWTPEQAGAGLEKQTTSQLTVREFAEREGLELHGCTAGASDWLS